MLTNFLALLLNKYLLIQKNEITVIAIPLTLKYSAMVGKFRLIDKKWVKRRWLDFRNGNGLYLVFFLTLAQFVIIQYRLLLEGTPLFHSIPLWVFSAVFVAIYVPLGVLIGVWHRRTQYNVENQTHFERNPIGATMYLFLIDLADGKVTEEEKKQMRRYLLEIMRKPERSLTGTNDPPQDVRYQKN
jgi:hypothetical protein